MSHLYRIFTYSEGKMVCYPLVIQHSYRKSLLVNWLVNHLKKSPFCSIKNWRLTHPIISSHPPQAWSGQAPFMRHVDKIRGGLFPEAPFIGDHKHPSGFRQGNEVARLCDLLDVPPEMTWGPGLAFIIYIYDICTCIYYIIIYVINNYCILMYVMI